jgi:membrane protein YqaA with SNARE-associated domain
MGNIVRGVQTLALALGAPGLFLVAFLDSSILSLPEIADLLVVYMVTHHRHRAALYAASATAGSLAGCLLLYYIGRKGGHALVQKRFSSDAVERALAAFQRHGIMAVLIPSILPPPAPFKIFVLLAGLADITPRQFTIAVIIGRGARYIVLTFLALRYGERTMAFLRFNGTTVSLVAVGALGLGFIAYLWWTKAQTRQRR